MANLSKLILEPFEIVTEESSKGSGRYHAAVYHPGDDRAYWLNRHGYGKARAEAVVEECITNPVAFLEGHILGATDKFARYSPARRFFGSVYRHSAEETSKLLTSYLYALQPQVRELMSFAFEPK